MDNKNSFGLLYSTKYEIYYRLDNITGNYITIYQRMKNKRSSLIFHRNELKHLYLKKNYIYKLARDCIDNSPTPQISQPTNLEEWFEEPMDIDVEPQAIDLQ